MEDKELTVIKSQLSKLENQALEVTITTAEENAIATDLKAKLKEFGKSIKERKEEITKPLNAALRSTRELFAPIEERFESAENIIGKKLIAYKQKVEAEARAEEEKIAAKLEEERKKIEAEIAAGKISEAKAAQKIGNKLSKAEEKINKIETVEKTQQTSYGKVQFRKIKKIRVTDESQVPDQYWEINMVKLRADLISGIVVPGSEVYEEEIV